MGARFARWSDLKARELRHGPYPATQFQVTPARALARGIHTVGEADSHTAKRPYVFFAVKAPFQYEKPEIARLKLHRRQVV